MTKRMLIDASHAEETRVVVLDGNRLEDFDVETSTKRQLKGNIYLAKVIRVEPSLQAAFVEYGGNRHGFLAFSEIHPDYYQIPVADRQRLIDMEAEEARLEEEEEDRAAGHPPARTEPAARPAVVAPVAQPEPAESPEPPPAETIDESGATLAMLEAAQADTPAEPEPPRPEAADESGAPAQEQAAAPAEPEPPAAETSDESGATGTILAESPPDAGPALQPAPDDSQTPEPPAAETGDESGATGTIPSEQPAEHEPAEAPQQPAPGEPQAPEPPAAETTDESGATGTMPGPEDDPDAPEPSRRRRRAQPMVIEPETLSGPVETAAEDAVSKPADPAEPEPPQAETVDESGATVAMLAEQPDTDHADVAVQERPRRNRRRSSEDAPFGDEESEFGDSVPESLPPETVGGEQDSEDRTERRIPPRFMRNYKIQEVIKRRQIMLVQVVKEERGTKGAALTTYISLAGRFSVLMPNSPRGGGISRKITSATDRRRLKEIVTEMDMPKGMGLIVRTAGANRPKPEIKRDCEYLLRLWDDIREHTLKSVAPALIYEEASLIKRAIRDVYSRDIDEITVDGEEGWRQAHEFMRMLMPSHAKKVQLWRDTQPLFARHQVETQLDNMLLPTVQLRSGGYLVINQTEALVAIDVNSGRSTRERNVEETALRTNLEAADEAARQLRLRDLAGLIVIDFIDMESRKHNGMVEKRLKEALKNDRARIQVGHISHFGLLEMSRQRLRPSLAETSFIPCPHCGGMGHVRSTESAALHVLRGIEDEGSKRRAAEIVVHVATPIALYILNHKRDRLNEIELRYSMRVTMSGDDRQIEPQFRIDRLRPQTAAAVPAVITPDLPPPPPPPPVPEPEEEDDTTAEDTADEATDATDAAEDARAEAAGESSAEEAERRRRRRRRRRRGRRDETAGPPAEPETAPESQQQSAQSDAPEPAEAETAETHIEGVPEHAEPPGGGEDDEDARNRRRGRRGGRRRRREPGDRDTPLITPDMEQPELPPVYTGPTPANPFGGHAFDIFDMLEQAEGMSQRPTAAPTASEVTMTPEPPREPEAAPPSEPAEQLEIVNTAAPEPVAEEPIRAAAEPEAPAGTTAEAEQPIGEPVEAAGAEAMPEPVAAAEPPAAEEPPPAEPAVKPIVIGSSDEPPAEKKRGWWRR